MDRDRNHQRRNRDTATASDGGGQDKHQPLNWTIEETFEQGSVRVEITSAAKQNGGGKLYSIVFGRVFNERTSKFFRPPDLEIVAKLSEEARLWIQADQGEHANDQSRRKYG